MPGTSSAESGTRTKRALAISSPNDASSNKPSVKELALELAKTHVSLICDLTDGLIYLMGLCYEGPSGILAVS